LEARRRPSIQDPLELQAQRPTRLQRRALRVLENSYSRLVRWKKWTEDLVNDPVYDNDIQDWLRALLRAARAGVLSNRNLVESSPAAQAARRRVWEWQSMGQKDFLAKARIGIERGVKRPLAVEDIEISNAIWDMMESPKYRTLQEIRRVLISRGVIPRLTKQRFYRLLDRLELRIK